MYICELVKHASDLFVMSLMGKMFNKAVCTIWMDGWIYTVILVLTRYHWCFIESKWFAFLKWTTTFKPKNNLLLLDKYWISSEIGANLASLIVCRQLLLFWYWLKCIDDYIMHPVIVVVDLFPRIDNMHYQIYCSAQERYPKQNQRKTKIKLATAICEHVNAENQYPIITLYYAYRS